MVNLIRNKVTNPSTLIKNEHNLILNQNSNVSSNDLSLKDNINLSNDDNLKSYSQYMFEVDTDNNDNNNSKLNTNKVNNTVSENRLNKK